MRVIKFRVRDKTLNTWSSNTQYFIHNRFSEKLYVVPEQGNRFIFEQYTGIKDKNGKEIFEGDIIRAEIKENSVPTRGEVVFDVFWQAYGYRNDAGFTMLSKVKNIEVIGNIYEEGGKD